MYPTTLLPTSRKNLLPPSSGKKFESGKVSSCSEQQVIIKLFWVYTISLAISLFAIPKGCIVFSSYFRFCRRRLFILFLDVMCSVLVVGAHFSEELASWVLRTKVETTGPSGTSEHPHPTTGCHFTVHHNLKLFLEVKLPVHEPNHSPPSTSGIKNAWSYICIPPCLHGVHWHLHLVYLRICVIVAGWM
jgi:hypothetical protein